VHGSGQVDPGTLFFPVLMLTIIEGKTSCVVYGKIQGLVGVSNPARDAGSKVVQSKGLTVEYKKLFKAGWICPQLHSQGAGVKTLFF